MYISIVVISNVSCHELWFNTFGMINSLLNLSPFKQFQNDRFYDSVFVHKIINEHVILQITSRENISRGKTGFRSRVT